MPSLIDAVISALTSQAGSASPRSRSDRIVIGTALVLFVGAVVFVIAVARGLG